MKSVLFAVLLAVCLPGQKPPDPLYEASLRFSLTFNTWSGLRSARKVGVLDFNEIRQWEQVRLEFARLDQVVREIHKQEAR